MEGDEALRVLIAHRRRNNGAGHEARIRGTMTGALRVIENEFGFLWTPATPAAQRSEIQREMFRLYQEVRNQILNLGNDQIRRFRSDWNNGKA
mgnify:CR=1 FL=1